MPTKFWLESRKGSYHSDDLRRIWEITLKCVLGKFGFGCGFNSCGSRWGPVAGSCEHDSKFSGSIKGGEFLDSKLTVNFSTRTLFPVLYSLA
jgi:hypothetical protein